MKCSTVILERTEPDLGWYGLLQKDDDVAALPQSDTLPLLPVRRGTSTQNIKSVRLLWWWWWGSLSSYLFVSSGSGPPPPPPNDICERQRENRQEIIITKCRILSFNLRTRSKL